MRKVILEVDERRVFSQFMRKVILKVDEKRVILEVDEKRVNLEDVVGEMKQFSHENY